MYGPLISIHTFGPSWATTVGQGIKTALGVGPPAATVVQLHLIMNAELRGMSLANHLSAPQTSSSSKTDQGTGHAWFGIIGYSRLTILRISRPNYLKNLFGKERKNLGMR